jgi:hypothetical protein
MLSGRVVPDIIEEFISADNGNGNVGVLGFGPTGVKDSSAEFGCKSHPLFLIRRAYLGIGEYVPG